MQTWHSMLEDVTADLLARQLAIQREKDLRRRTMNAEETKPNVRRQRARIPASAVQEVVAATRTYICTRWPAGVCAESTITCRDLPSEEKAK